MQRDTEGGCSMCMLWEPAKASDYIYDASVGSLRDSNGVMIPFKKCVCTLQGRATGSGRRRGRGRFKKKDLNYIIWFR